MLNWFTKIQQILSPHKTEHGKPGTTRNQQPTEPDTGPPTEQDRFWDKVDEEQDEQERLAVERAKQINKTIKPVLFLTEVFPTKNDVPPGTSPEMRTLLTTLRLREQKSFNYHLYYFPENWDDLHMELSKLSDKDYQMVLRSLHKGIQDWKLIGVIP